MGDAAGVSAADLPFAVPNILRHDRHDGAVFLESFEFLGPIVKNVGTWLREWAAVDPDHTLAAERDPNGPWRRLSYGVAWVNARAIGQALLDRGLSADRPLMMLSGNSLAHLQVTLGALVAGVPVAPVSVAYSTQSRDHARLRAIAALLRPGAVYADDAAEFRAAIEAVGVPIVLSSVNGPAEHTVDELKKTATGLHAEVAARAVAKILFTSGSTGTPKGVLNTHEMLCVNQQMMRQVWPFLAAERPVLVDWLPWSHTFGGNHNVFMMLANGGTLYLDAGRPVPGLIETSIINNCEVGPTLAFNVPSGWAQVVPTLEKDLDTAAQFFGRLRIAFNASAALPGAVRSRLEDLALRVTGRRIPVTGSWGTTETAPAATTAHYEYADARCIGVPLPGVTLKLVPNGGDTYELRCRGRLVTPGYLGLPDGDAEVFDEDGFYRPGDAVSFADPDDPNAGLLFEGRLTEDFKLGTGTFVRVGPIRTALLSAIPLLADAVIAGNGRDEIRALAWLNYTETAQTPIGEVHSPDGEVLYSPELAQTLGAALADHNSGKGSASRVMRLIILARPASLDAGEITDKGYVNQRHASVARSPLVDRLYADDPYSIPPRG